MKNIDDKTCDSLKILGDYWTLRIIAALEDEPLRFCELQRQVDNLNPVTLTGRLKRLEQGGLVDRNDQDGASVVYSLADLGRSALGVLRSIEKFSKALSSQKS
jgi:DNA-binding HxlR family transcriptional regulator